jgi:4-hydroxy-tetrahydrodipicolinate synthase
MNWKPAAPIFAIVTPFTGNGAIDDEALPQYLAWLSGRGVSRVVACGTTGEFPSLTIDERKHILELTRACFPGQVIAHVSACAVSQVRDLLVHASKHSDAALLLPPYYYGDASPDGVLKFYVEAAADSALPLYAYNFPRHTQFNITPQFLASLDESLPALRGIKDSGGNWDTSVAYKRELPHLEVVVGSDSAALRALQKGLDGSVTGGANAVPQLMVQVHEYFTSNDTTAAIAAQQQFDEWTAARKATGQQEIPLVKAVLSHLLPGFPPHVRAPFIQAKAPDELLRLAEGA